MKKYEKILQDEIENEKILQDDSYSQDDLSLMNEMFDRINAIHSTNFHFLAELDSIKIPLSDLIIVEYINKFQSETIRSYLIPQLVSGNWTNRDLLILELYRHFKGSSVYISQPNVPAPAHIYVRYDNAFVAMKSKRIKEDLIKLISNPRDAFYLPLTTKMLASWKLPEMENILITYLNSDKLTFAEVGLKEDTNHLSYPPLSFIQRELKFIAIESLKFFPSNKNFDNLQNILISSSDNDIKLATKKCLVALSKKVKMQ